MSILKGEHVMAPVLAGPRLSPRELEVLAHIAEGRTIHQVSRRLGISPSTVQTYLCRLRDKLEAPTKAHLIRAAVDRGL